jgi:hypothetical protein
VIPLIVHEDMDHAIGQILMCRRSASAERKLSLFGLLLFFLQDFGMTAPAY